MAGTPAENDEVPEAAWFKPAELERLDIHPTMRWQIDRYLNKKYPHID